MDSEADPVHGLDLPNLAPQQPAQDRKVLLEVFDLEQDVAHWYSVHRTQWPGLTSVSGTSSGPKHRSRFGAGQRGENVQPVGSVNGSGTLPGIVANRRFTLPPTRG